MKIATGADATPVFCGADSRQQSETNPWPKRGERRGGKKQGWMGAAAINPPRRSTAMKTIEHPRHRPTDELSPSTKM
jgi:hypothetical protein